MSSSNLTNTSGSIGSKSSRFSTLKVFKFGSSKEPKSKDGARPPPPPPKDPYYMQNRSMMSLSPTSQPGTPMDSIYPSAPFARKPGLHSNGSAVSLVSTSAASAMSYNPETGSHTSKAGSFFRFGRRTPRSPSIRSATSTADDMHSMHQESDDGISLPWNFQHNLHVDEGMSQLPPSWLAELQNRGFSPEEIAVINQKRLASQQQQASLNSITSDRAYSPSLNIPRTDSPSPIGPRSTTLPRQYSQSSITSAQSRPIVAPALVASPDSSVASLPGPHDSPHRPRPGYAPTSSSHSHQPSSSSYAMSMSAESYSAESHSAGTGQSAPNGAPRIYINESSPMKPSRAPPPSPPGSQTGSYVSRPHTPPRQRSTFRVANASPPSPTGSPPPSYTPSAEHFPTDTKDPSLLASSSTTNGSSPTEDESQSLTPTGSPAAKPRQPTLLDSRPSTDSARSAKRRSKRFSAAPPRLSIHEDNFGGFGLGLGLGLGDDLSSWSQSLLSSIPDTGSPLSATSGPTPTSATYPSSSLPSAASTTQSAPTNSNPAPPNGAQAPNDDAADHTLQRKTSRSRLSKVQEEEEPRTFSGDWEDHRATILWSQMNGRESTMAEPPTPAPLQSAHAPDSRASLSPPRNRASAYRIGPDGKVVAEREDGLDEDDSLLSAGDRENRFSSQSVASTISTSTIMAHALPTTITQASVARRMQANVIDGQTTKLAPSPLLLSKSPGDLPSPQPSPPAQNSPAGSTFGSSDDGSSSSSSADYPTPVTDLDGDAQVYYLNPADARKQAYLPSPTASTFSSNRDSGSSGAVEVVPKPKIVVSDSPTPPTAQEAPQAEAPLPPMPRVHGWLADAVAPFADFIDEPIDPRAAYVDLQEIAEGESGSVFAAHLVESYVGKLRLPASVAARDAHDRAAGQRTLVAIKQVAVTPHGSQKLLDLQHELRLMRGLAHENILGMDAMYVDVVEDMLWIRMDLMERSLADVIELVNEGLMLQERMIARFAGDILLGLDYLHKQGIAHRDVRSDNLLINNSGVVRITDFSQAVKVTPEAPLSSEVVGVVYWQAPEMRVGPYDPLKADIWSLGATVWETAQAEPPFAETQVFMERWPAVRQPELFSPAFHEFLRLCSEPAAVRPNAAALMKSAFTTNACGRAVIVQLLSQCMAIERRMQEELGEDS